MKRNLTSFNLKKTKKETGFFTPEDVENLKIIFNLINERGFTLQGARDYLKQNGDEARESQQIISTLEEVKKFLLEVKEQL